MDLQIPVVSLRQPVDDLWPQVDRAAREYGFFQVVDHGVPDALIRDVWKETRAFFHLPRSEKLAIARTKENPRGYYDRELTKNRRDLKEVFDYAGTDMAEVDGRNQWPAGHPVFRDIMTSYFDACTVLGHRLMELLCIGIGVDARALRPQFDPIHTSFVRLNYYPIDDPLSGDEASTVTPLGDMALHHHTDAGALTILLQDDVGGLQVKVGDHWVDATPTDGAFVINVGDMMQVWSNDRYVAALHRVLPRTNRERYSLPFFFNPSYETNYAPLGPDEPRYTSINWGKFRQARTDGDYADFGKEIQIADFRAGTD